MNTIQINPFIDGTTNTLDNGLAGWYRMHRHDNQLALRVASSNIGLQGEIRFNPELGIFQGYDGNVWINFRDNLILNEQLQIPEKIAQINRAINTFGKKISEIEYTKAELTSIKIELGNLIDKHNNILNKDTITKTHKYKYTGDIIVGSAVVLSNYDGHTPFVSRFSYSGGKLNPFVEKCNIIGVVDKILEDGYCSVVVEGPTFVNMVATNITPEFPKSLDIKNGVIVILDSSGNGYQTTRKPLNDFIQIGFAMENGKYDGKMIYVWINPKIYVL